MSEFLPAPDPGRFPPLDRDPSWVREVPAGTALARIFRAGGEHPAEWFEFREFGPLDARFDPHPEPIGEHPGCGVMYAVLEGEADPSGGAEVPHDSAFAACVLEVFQQFRIVRRSAGAPTLVTLELARPIRLLDLSDSDWIAVAGGNAAIASGERSRSREWARAIARAHPELDGVLAASSLVPTARVAALWNGAVDALPEHPLSLLRLDREELTPVIDAVAERYRYTLL
ncbi:hypothetical protein JD276_03025 [Leucobacter sp. CSA1]|uniref:RES domain-containing protein n=1 Tax=Leucobacter chromiisoli TaxID=2796471 RepID=A0A934UUJ8_9MICO|nr:hypothetical protein [Leucobacter chromiisoli]MBK0418007.1 hypothetical protein [Leucobacter chromiisoli]